MLRKNLLTYNTKQKAVEEEHQRQRFIAYYCMVWHAATC